MILSFVQLAGTRRRPKPFDLFEMCVVCGTHNSVDVHISIYQNKSPSTRHIDSLMMMLMLMTTTHAYFIHTYLYVYIDFEYKYALDAK